ACARIHPSDIEDRRIRIGNHRTKHRNRLEQRILKKPKMTELKAGAATVNITPQESHFLFGYPFVDRMSTGTHDDLLSSALYLTDGKNQVLFISNDVIYVSKASTARIREGISKETGIQASNILVAATHTHS
ncbi:MAG TPA: hypothetical protein DDZ57_05750, partial [Porphyromonadaceae bacterium]|nr:hypothetical protein [Porphyromonadaceae bacterium]